MTVDMRQVGSLAELRQTFYPQRSQTLLYKFMHDVATTWQEKQAEECSKITGTRDC